MDLQDYRKKINEIDETLVKTFLQRMEVAGEIARYKEANGLKVLDARREREKLREVEEMCPEEMQEYASSLYSLLFELSRSYQNSLMESRSPLSLALESAMEGTPKLFPEKAVVACQGVEGAYSQLACERLFTRPNIFYFDSFDAVFSAIEKGLCQYGVIPLENSTAGSVNKVYDLMMSHRFSITRSVRLKVDHNLLAKPGVELKDVKEIFSHQQAIDQCAGFLSSLPGVKVTAFANTAMAARMVAESPRNDVAALASRSCMSLYGLRSLRDSVQDQENNYTRFICISRNLEIYPGADHTSLMMILPHKPGSLYKVLARFYALGINLIKLESRPLPDRNFEFMFYFDLETSVYSSRFVRLMAELDDVVEEFTYLGSYSEVI